MNRPLVSLLFVAALQMPALFAGAETPGSRRTAQTAHSVHIDTTSLPDGSMGRDIGPTLWSVQGYDLRSLFASVYLFERARVDVEATSTLKAVNYTGPEASRFDVSLALKGDETDEAIQATLRAALEQRFHVAASIETREVEVYVLTAPSGAGPGLHRASGRGAAVLSAAPDEDNATGEITVEGQNCPGISSATISGHAVTTDRLAAALEDNLDRPVVNETNLAGVYDFRLPEYRSVDQLKSVLRDQLGVTLTTERRTIKVLTVRPARDSNTTLQSGL